MAEYNIPHLCGGVFYFLLAQMKISTGTSRDHRNGIKDEHTDPIMMADLIYAVTGNTHISPEMVKKDASNYRECKFEGGSNLPFKDIPVCDTYNSEVIKKYPDTLKRMSEFINWHIDFNLKEWLVKALLEIIENDIGILEDHSFYICSDGRPISKTEIIKMTTFEFQPFLVGVMHYILQYRKNKNKLGFDTLNALGTKIPRNERELTSEIGNKITRKISVIDFKINCLEFTNIENEIEVDMIANDTEDTTDTIEAEVVDDDKSSGAAEDKSQESTNMQIINNPTIVNQYGEKNIHIEYVDKLIF